MSVSFEPLENFSTHFESNCEIQPGGSWRVSGFLCDSYVGGVDMSEVEEGEETVGDPLSVT